MFLLAIKSDYDVSNVSLPFCHRWLKSNQNSYCLSLILTMILFTTMVGSPHLILIFPCSIWVSLSFH